MSELDDDLGAVLLCDACPFLPDLELRSSERFLAHDDVSWFREEADVDLDLARNQQSVLRFAPETVQAREEMHGRGVERQARQSLLLEIGTTQSQYGVCDVEFELGIVYERYASPVRRRRGEVRSGAMPVRDQQKKQDSSSSAQQSRRLTIGHFTSLFGIVAPHGSSKGDERVAIADDIFFPATSGSEHEDVSASCARAGRLRLTE